MSLLPIAFEFLKLMVLVLLWFFLEAKMWGVGAEQGGILQTSTAKLELKEPYYRMSQPQQYMPQDQQQPLSSLQAQVSWSYFFYLYVGWAHCFEQLALCGMP
jgi:hypothetical protein